MYQFSSPRLRVQWLDTSVCFYWSQIASFPQSWHNAAGKDRYKRIKPVRERMTTRANAHMKISRLHLTLGDILNRAIVECTVDWRDSFWSSCEWSWPAAKRFIIFLLSVEWYFGFVGKWTECRVFQRVRWKWRTGKMQEQIIELIFVLTSTNTVDGAVTVWVDSKLGTE